MLLLKVYLGLFDLQLGVCNGFVALVLAGVLEGLENVLVGLLVVFEFIVAVGDDFESLDVALLVGGNFVVADVLDVFCTVEHLQRVLNARNLVVALAEGGEDMRVVKLGLLEVG